MDLISVLQALLNIVYDPKKSGVSKGFELEAVLFEFTAEGILQMTATNGHMLATVRINGTVKDAASFLIHNYHLKKVIKRLSGTLNIYPYERQLYFTDNKGGLIVTDPSSGEFPDFKKIIGAVVTDDTAVPHIKIEYITLAIAFLKATGAEIITVTRQPAEPGRPMLLETGEATVLIMPYDPKTV
jgi:hypothetical protein